MFRVLNQGCICFCFLLKDIEFTQHSTGLLLGSQVDGLPGALHTEALGAPHGWYAPAAIDTLDKKEIENV